MIRIAASGFSATSSSSRLNSLKKVAVRYILFQKRSFCTHFITISHIIHLSLTDMCKSALTDFSSSALHCIRIDELLYSTITAACIRIASILQCSLSKDRPTSFWANHAGQLSSSDVHWTRQWSTLDFNRVDVCLALWCSANCDFRCLVPADEAASSSITVRLWGQI